LKSRKGNWGELFDVDGLDVMDLDGADEGILFLEEAHEALNRLTQKANKRGGLMKQPRRAESWD
jgi:hypothetical protein